MPKAFKNKLFPLGQTVITHGAELTLKQFPHLRHRLLERHVSGDWGDIDAVDRALNDAAVRNQSRIHSAYKIPNGVNVWIITEWDRSSSTILLPEEY